MRFWRQTILGVVVGLSLSLLATGSDKNKPKEGMKVVDSGSFGIFVNGRRVATETFDIQQGPTGSIAKSQFKTEAGDSPSVQSSVLELTPGGEIVKYEFSEESPGKGEASVVPANEFLTERIKKSPTDKPEEQPFLLPASTSILDDYFFSHREILIWRFLATACKPENKELKCPANQRTQFGTLNPHQRTSQAVGLEFTGKDKVNIRGTEQALDKFVLKSEAGDWLLWVDANFKVQRILISSDNTEVVRD